MTEPDMKEKILDAAETMIRGRGYNGFSFREIADVVGVKSASVHYHFPTKAALGVAVAKRYTDGFLEALGPVEDAPESAAGVQDKLHALARLSLVEEDLMCLCGMLGAEVADLPEGVAAEARHFFERSTEWLSGAFANTAWGQGAGPEEMRKLALSTLAASEGALILARTMKDVSIFDDITLPRPQ
ncbi:Biofilm operon icaADBC HTH-type negative transcriptional regulator IcaR [Roseovarius litorisediminis]|uniref:Biofilm operon icaADBC HTH-type negative transcriptional regulator IcaR n=1 Tax=Roseovarius litorisediminis TaxID=1312363 RepID=A0A1Y5T2K9_9RHOB|nr:TetR/AcrR family transcriptional regulator [Roseovarius litorisediminis]SLN54578.1 Biofilm operon icaADBC HTH-type negative transcriptional regulator IcaR [Roseovarius litorisediminis]